MEYGLQTRGSYEHVLTAARWAEDRGLACFALPDHYLTSAVDDISQPAYDNFAVVAGLARETSTIRLSILVAPITFRHPAVLAKNAVTIDEMSGGRFSLGVGTGWLKREHEIFGLPFPLGSERFERMEESLAYLRAMFTPGEVGFSGKHYQLEAVDVGPNPGPGLKLVVGGVGPHKTPTLAGRYGDEYNGYPDHPDEMRRRIALARSEAGKAGRDPNALLISSSGFLVIGRDDAEYQTNLARTATLLNQTPDELEEYFNKRSTPRGTAAQVVDMLGAMEEAGVERFYVQALSEASVEPIEEILGLIGA